MKKNEKNGNETETKKPLFNLRAKYHKHKSGFIIEIKLNKELKDFLRKGLTNESEIRESTNWKDKNGNLQKFYYGGFNLITLFNNLNGNSYNRNEINDSFGSSNIKGNLALLRAESLIKNGKCSYLFETALFCDIKSLLNELSDFLAKISKNITTGIVEIKGYEIKTEMKIKESVLNEEEGF